MGIIAIVAGLAVVALGAAAQFRSTANETGSPYNIADYGAKANDPSFDNAPVIKGSANNGFGIDAQTVNDRVSIENMAFNNVGVAIRLKGADAARISGSWIAETVFGIELTGASRATATDSCPPASATTWPMTIGPTCTRYGREAAASWSTCPPDPTRTCM